MKAMYIVGEDMALVDSNANYVHDMLSKLDFLVVQDIFFSRTAQYADVILPAVHRLKKMVHLRIQKDVYNDYTKHFLNWAMRKADWWIVQEIANRLGARLELSVIQVKSLQKWRVYLHYSVKQIIA